MKRKEKKELIWRKLDNSAKIFPLSSSRKYSSVFRLSAVMKENISPKLLEKAVNNALNKFEFFKVRLKKGFFWYYFEYNDKKVVIEEEKDYPCKYIDKNTVDIDCTNVDSYRPLGDLTRKMRGSSYLMGALLGRFSNFIVDPPGGCDFGTRPIDQHIKAFETLGADIDTSKGVIEGSAENLSGGNIFFDVITVGATINAMLAATTANGITVIENAAKEPHIVDLANFLNNMGANIRGAGTDTIKIKGTKDLHGGTYTIIPDQIEAGTFMLAAVATKGDLLLKNCITKHLESITAKIIEVGGNVEDHGDSIRVWCNKRPNKANIKTLPYPGFPTDLQPQMGVVLSLANGTSTINESIWESRFQYTEELNKMGAKITAHGKNAFFEGVKKLSGAPVYSTDLRAGAALVIAGTAAEGISEIYNLQHIDRGYENIEEKFRKIGAKIKRVTE